MSLDIITDQMGAELLIENKGLGRFWKGPCFSKEYQPELQKKISVLPGRLVIAVAVVCRLTVLVCALNHKKIRQSADFSNQIFELFNKRRYTPAFLNAAETMATASVLICSRCSCPLNDSM